MPDTNRAQQHKSICPVGKLVTNQNKKQGPAGEIPKPKDIRPPRRTSAENDFGSILAHLPRVDDVIVGVDEDVEDVDTRDSETAGVLEKIPEGNGSSRRKAELLTHEKNRQVFEAERSTKYGAKDFWELKEGAEIMEI
ncbi:hypothetical protein L596_007546 [Steinernema carpocapsae]|uniref:Uncharacterized protein n=1 Tax=Steinernema carpocapsae TaxID=34508 RepID=A0A4U5PA18_STECR|nr:hypothetical protein L596_007546 [Steinernema carpocapsae]